MDLLGGNGANLAEMARLGPPVRELVAADKRVFRAATGRFDDASLPSPLTRGVPASPGAAPRC